MNRAQRIDRSKSTKHPQIIDTRQPKTIPQLAPVDPAVAHLPLRTVILLEVGDMEPAKVQLLIQEANKMYDGARGGIHYITPVRHGRIGTDIVFEHEWLSIVQQTCEFDPTKGQIVLKEGAQECRVVRESF